MPRATENVGSIEPDIEQLLSFGNLKKKGDPRALHVWEAYNKTNDKKQFHEDILCLLQSPQIKESPSPSPDEVQHPEINHPKSNSNPPPNAKSNNNRTKKDNKKIQGAIAESIDANSATLSPLETTVKSPSVVSTVKNDQNKEPTKKAKKTEKPKEDSSTKSKTSAVPTAAEQPTHASATSNPKLSTQAPSLHRSAAPTPAEPISTMPAIDKDQSSKEKKPRKVKASSASPQKVAAEAPYTPPPPAPVSPDLVELSSTPLSTEPQSMWDMLSLGDDLGAASKLANLSLTGELSGTVSNLGTFTFVGGDAGVGCDNANPLNSVDGVLGAKSDDGTSLTAKLVGSLISPARRGHDGEVNIPGPPPVLNHTANGENPYHDARSAQTQAQYNFHPLTFTSGGAPALPPVAYGTTNPTEGTTSCPVQGDAPLPTEQQFMSHPMPGMWPPMGMGMMMPGPNSHMMMQMHTAGMYVFPPHCAYPPMMAPIGYPGMGMGMPPPMMDMGSYMNSMQHMNNMQQHMQQGSWEQNGEGQFWNSSVGYFDFGGPQDQEQLGNADHRNGPKSDKEKTPKKSRPRKDKKIAAAPATAASDAVAVRTEAPESIIAATVDAPHQPYVNIARDVPSWDTKIDTEIAPPDKRGRKGKKHEADAESKAAPSATAAAKADPIPVSEPVVAPAVAPATIAAATSAVSIAPKDKEKKLKRSKVKAAAPAAAAAAAPAPLATNPPVPAPAASESKSSNSGASKALLSFLKAAPSVPKVDPFASKKK